MGRIKTIEELPEAEEGTVYLIVSEFGLSNVYFEEEHAIAQAKYFHELEDTEDSDYCAVWVIDQGVGHNDGSWPIGMFPDRKGTGSPGEWVSAYDEDGKQKRDFPWPRLTFGGTRTTQELEEQS